jgi:membrane protease YdiL (CAAX protease family)
VVPATVFVTAGLALWVYGYYGSMAFYQRVLAVRLPLDPGTAAAAPFFYWYGSTFLTLVLLPTLVLRVAERLAPAEERVGSLGWGLGEWRVGVPAALVFCGFMLVLVGVAVSTPDFRGKYPLFADAGRSLGTLVAYEAAYAAYFVSWEFFFRGFLTLGLAQTLGIWAVFVQMLPCVVLHFGKPDLEVMSSVFGGIVLGYLALRTGSIWYGAAVHVLTAVTLDILALALR